MRCVWAMLVLAGLAGREARGCGLHWSKPVNHFDGVCEEGYVSHWEDWGTVDFGDGLKLPLIVGFRSDRNTDSPYLGRGWIVALLESHAYALEERKLRVVMPDGYHYTFRKQKNGVWDGNRGWLGEFKGNTFTAWAPCGWKIEWRDGKIQTMWTDKGRRIDYSYNGSMCTGMSENGRERVKVERTGDTGQVSGLAFTEDAITGGLERISVTLDRKPEVDVRGGVPFVGRFTRSLSRTRRLDGVHRDYAFSADVPNNKSKLNVYEDGQESQSPASCSRLSGPSMQRENTWIRFVVDPPLTTVSATTLWARASSTTSTRRWSARKGPSVVAGYFLLTRTICRYMKN